MGVAEPNGTAAPVLSVTEGCVKGFVETLAPENVSVLRPVYVGTRLSDASLAVIVRFWGVPAVCVPDPAITSLPAPPGVIVTESDVPAFADDVAVNVPAPIFPVNFIPIEVRLATPATKSLDLFRTLLLLVPRPLTVPVNDVVTVTLLADASKAVSGFPQSSCAVNVFVPVKATPLI